MSVFFVTAWLVAGQLVTEAKPQQSWNQCMGNLQRFSREGPPGRYGFCLSFGAQARA